MKYIIFIILIALFFLLSYTVHKYNERKIRENTVVYLEIFREKFRLKTEDEITDIFKKNISDFTALATNLDCFDFSWDLRKDIFYRDDYLSVDLENGIHLIIQDKNNFHRMEDMKKAAESDKSAEKILHALNFEIICRYAHVDSNCIEFVFQTRIGFSSGIAYSPNQKPQNPYFTKITEISPSWYYFESK